jgi:hypothetical protein
MFLVLNSAVTLGVYLLPKRLVFNVGGTARGLNGLLNLGACGGLVVPAPLTLLKPVTLLTLDGALNCDTLVTLDKLLTCGTLLTLDGALNCDTLLTLDKLLTCDNLLTLESALTRDTLLTREILLPKNGLLIVCLVLA